MSKSLHVVFLLIIFQPRIETFPTELVIDIINSLGSPIFIRAFLCYNKTDSVHFIKTLSKHNIAVNVYRNTIELFPSHFTSNNVLFLVDLFCEHSTNLINKANEMNLFSSPNKWLLIDENVLETPVNSNVYSNTNMLVDSQIIIASFIEENVYNVIEIYRKDYRSNFEKYEIGCWKSNSGYTPYKGVEMRTKRRTNLSGVVLKASIVVTHNDSLNHLTDGRDSHIDTITKVNYVLIKYLGDMLNATLQYSVQNTWGYKDNNSQWNGMIGELQRNEADIGGTPLFVTSDRVPVIDYIAMTSPSRSYFVFRQPKLSYVSNVYILPFHWTVWLSILFLIIITTIGLYTIGQWDFYKGENGMDNGVNLNNNVYKTWLDVILLTFGAMCQQGSSVIPVSVPGRIITILMFISLMFLYTSYSANIVALLQTPSNSIQSLSDLLHSRLDVGVDDTVFNHFYFPNAIEPVRRALYLQKVAPHGQKPKFMSIDEGVRKMRYEHFAFHMETGVGYKIVLNTFEEHEKCGLKEIQFIQVSEPWIAIQKNLSYKKILKIGLHKIQESGIQAREFYMLYTKKPECTNMGSSFMSVGIVDCYMAAVVLVSGVFLASVSFLLELIIFHRDRFKRRTITQAFCTSSRFRKKH